MQKGQIFKIHSDFYYVQSNENVFECKLRHVLKKQKQSVFVGDFVLAGYGTGAVMAVPCHDQRDYDFAKAFDIPMKQVIITYHPIMSKSKLL